MTAAVTIETGLRKGMGFLKSCYCTPPFKVLDITEDRRSNTLHLMLMSSSPGVLDGDIYTFKIAVASGCHLALYTQSYQRLFPMERGAAQHIEITMEEGSSFTFLPHPSVPHHQSYFTSIANIHLSKSCRLVWGEVLTSGRGQNGETFAFTRFQSCTQIYKSTRLVVKENQVLQPALTPLHGLGQWEGFTHQASFIYLEESIAIPTLIQQFYDWLEAQPQLCFGITALPENGLLVRLLGYKAEYLHGLLKKLAALLPAPVATSKEDVYAG